MLPQTEYRVFISYSRTDLEIVGPVVNLMRLADSRVFRDIDHIPAGARWRAVLETAIEHCEKVVLFWCQHSSASDEVKKEYSLALSKNKILVPVLLDDTKLPSELAEFQAIDLRKTLGEHREVEVQTVQTVKGLLDGVNESKSVRRVGIHSSPTLTALAAQQLKEEIGIMIFSKKPDYND